MSKGRVRLREPSRAEIRGPKEVRDAELIIQDDDDQIVPFADSGLLQSELIKGATLKVYKGGPHACAQHTKRKSTMICWSFSIGPGEWQRERRMSFRRQYAE
jgi:hypothetical protein